MVHTDPILVIPCKRGGVPRLTSEQVRDILEEEERVISLSLFDANGHAAPCTVSGSSFTEFCNLNGFQLILTIRSPYVGMHASVPSLNTAVLGDHESGRLCFSYDKWNEMVSAVKPAMAFTLYDPLPLYGLPSKRRNAAVGRSHKWSQMADSSPNRVTCKWIKPVCVSSDNTVYVFAEDLCQNETLQQYASRLKEIASKYRVMATAPSVAGLLTCLKAGVSFIECTLPWVLAEKGIALTLNTYPILGESPSRYTTQMDLNDYCFAVDIQPLNPGCDCHTCKRHTRAYIHHLLTVQEMNAHILLTIHNLKSLVRVVRLYRRSSKDERDALIDWLFRQL
ncbi:queuine tRNA-ribosyltransferase [Trypanosoma vivax]|nr:queuine tRNA-ribosyltransferase [Trypanosoma vivax]